MDHFYCSRETMQRLNIMILQLCVKILNIIHQEQIDLDSWCFFCKQIHPTKLNVQENLTSNKSNLRQDILFFHQQRKYPQKGCILQTQIIGHGVDKLLRLYEALGTKLRIYSLGSFCWLNAFLFLGLRTMGG